VLDGEQDVELVGGRAIDVVELLVCESKDRRVVELVEVESSKAAVPRTGKRKDEEEHDVDDGDDEAVAAAEQEVDVVVDKTCR
jgi:hypothetical protein